MLVSRIFPSICCKPAPFVELRSVTTVDHSNILRVLKFPNNAIDRSQTGHREGGKAGAGRIGDPLGEDDFAAGDGSRVLSMEVIAVEFSLVRTMLQSVASCTGGVAPKGVTREMRQDTLVHISGTSAAILFRRVRSARDHCSASRGRRGDQPASGLSRGVGCGLVRLLTACRSLLSVAIYM